MKTLLCLLLLSLLPMLCRAQSPNAWPPVYVWAAEGREAPTFPTRTRAALPVQTYPEEEYTAGANPYLYRADALSVFLTSDSSQSPTLLNHWIRLNQDSQIKANFPPGTRCLLFPNAGTITLMFAPAVHGVSVALGNSDFGAQSFRGEGFNGTVSLGVKTLSGQSGKDYTTAPAPVLTFTAASPKALTSLTITKTGERPQFGIILGPLTLTP